MTQHNDKSFTWPNDEIDFESDKDTFDLRLVSLFGEKYIRPLFVIVECWEHKKYGRGKRLYNAEFTEQERKKLAQYHNKLYDWYLRRGIPQHGVQMSMQTFELLQRAANFFASL